MEENRDKSGDGRERKGVGVREKERVIDYTWELMTLYNIYNTL